MGSIPSLLQGIKLSIVPLKSSEGREQHSGEHCGGRSEEQEGAEGAREGARTPQRNFSSWEIL